MSIKKICIFLLLLICTTQILCFANDSVKNYIKHNEGLVLKPYKDPGKNKNNLIGYGHNLDAGITIEMAECLLEIDIKLARDFLKRVFEDFDDFSENRQIALIDMVYCMGPACFLTFKKMIRAIRTHDWLKAAEEIRNSLWYKKFTTRATKDMKLLLNNDLFLNSN